MAGGEALFKKVDSLIKDFQKKKGDVELPHPDHEEKIGKNGEKIGDGLYRGEYKRVIVELRKNKTAFTEWKTGFGNKENLSNPWNDVDEKFGRYRFDCCGFVKYMLTQALPKDSVALESMKKFLVQEYHYGGRKLNYTSGSGQPEEWVDWAVILKNNGGRKGGWELVAAPGYKKGHVDVIRKGDILIKRDPKYPEDPKKKRGHALIAMGEPNASGHLWIADSTGMKNKHSDDTRKDSTVKIQHTGMGKGYIKVVTEKGKPGMYWTKEPRGHLYDLYVLRPL